MQTSIYVGGGTEYATQLALKSIKCTITKNVKILNRLGDNVGKYLNIGGLMREKRFYIEDEHIKDKLEAHNPFYVETYNEAERFCELLNDLNQEVIDAEHYHSVVLENFKVISKDYNELKEENKQLKKELKVYRKIASCANCNYHNYDWFDDGDEFEVCDKGNDTSNMICEDWEELD